MAIKLKLHDMIIIVVGEFNLMRLLYMFMQMQGHFPGWNRHILSGNAMDHG